MYGGTQSGRERLMKLREGHKGRRAHKEEKTRSLYCGSWKGGARKSGKGAAVEAEYLL